MAPRAGLKFSLLRQTLQLRPGQEDRRRRVDKSERTTRLLQRPPKWLLEVLTPERSPVQSKSDAEEFERRHGAAFAVTPREEVPTFAAHANEFIETYAASNNKPSEREAKACILKHHLLWLSAACRHPRGAERAARSD